MDHPALPQTLPRERWAEHPNFPDHVLLLGSHANFRRLSGDLVEHCGSVPDVQGIYWLYRRWIAAMRSHETYEEHKLYPYLSRRWSLSMEAAQRGHEQLHTRDDEVRRAFAAVRRNDEPKTRAELEQALVAHDEALRAHLQLEEDLVIPLLLELERDEFEAYTMLPIEELLRGLDDG